MGILFGLLKEVVTSDDSRSRECVKKSAGRTMVSNLILAHTEKYETPFWGLVFHTTADCVTP
jgi:hypothetical protein